MKVIGVKENKDDSLYGFPPPKGPCRDCIHFEEVPGAEEGAGISDKTNGRVLPEFGCMNFELRADLKRVNVRP